MAFLVASRLNKVLQINVQRVCYSVDVVEISDHLRCVVNRNVVESCIAKINDVLLRH